MEEVMKHSLGRGNLTEEWFYVFYPININGFYADQIYLLRGKKIFVNLKCLILLKIFSLWLSCCLLDTFQFPSFAEQLPLLATAQSAKPQEDFAEICP